MNQKMIAFAEEIILVNSKNVEITRIALQRLDDAHAENAPQMASPAPKLPSFACGNAYYECQGFAVPDAVVYAAKVLKYFGANIPAIKLIRTWGESESKGSVTIGLKEAKDFVDGLSVSTVTY